jgi:SH3-like domain-containing protein
MDRQNRIAIIRLRYEIEYRNPIQVTAGEIVEVGRPDEDQPGWLWCRATDGREGWMPVEYLSGVRPRATVLRDYSAKELSVEAGDRVEVAEVYHGWALVRNAQGSLGRIPESHLGDSIVRRG